LFSESSLKKDLARKPVVIATEAGLVRANVLRKIEAGRFHTMAASSRKKFSRFGWLRQWEFQNLKLYLMYLWNIDKRFEEDFDLVSFCCAKKSWQVCLCWVLATFFCLFFVFSCLSVTNVQTCSFEKLRIIFDDSQERFCSRYL